MTSEINLTELDYELVDILLLKLPPNEQFSIHKMYNYLDSTSLDISDQKLYTLKNRLKESHPIIRKFLLQNDYIECVNSSYPKDILKSAGKKAKELGGHQKYIEWQEEENNNQKKITWPQKNWFPIMLFTAIIAPIATDVFDKVIIQKAPNKSVSAIQIKYDTVYICRVDSNHNEIPPNDSITNKR